MVQGAPGLAAPPSGESGGQRSLGIDPEYIQRIFTEYIYGACIEYIIYTAYMLIKICDFHKSIHLNFLDHYLL